MVFKLPSNLVEAVHDVTVFLASVALMTLSFDDLVCDIREVYHVADSRRRYR